MSRWASYLRAPFLLFFALFFTGFMSAFGILVFIGAKDRRRHLNWIRAWASGLVRACGLEIHLLGLKNIPTGGGIYVFNHTSLFDIPVMHSALPVDFRFGAKAELFKIPVFGAAMRKAGALEIARRERHKTIHVYRRSVDRIHRGESFVLAPEGTRQKSERLGEFKSGPFVLAIEAQAPIIPVVLCGLSQVLPRKSLLINAGFWRRPVWVEVLPPIATSGMTFDDRERLKSLVREQMHHALQRLQSSKSRLHPELQEEAAHPSPHRLG